MTPSADKLNPREFEEIKGLEDSSLHDRQRRSDTEYER